MINFNDIANIYFLGIGGIGMSALARYAHAVGKNVAGYDLTETQLTKQLQGEGIAVHYNEDINQFSTTFLKENTLVVRTPAVPDTHLEYQFLVENNYQIIKRSQLLGFLTDSKMCIAVAGTHGKTSVSTMTTHLLFESGVEVGAFLGGISRNFESNLVLPPHANSLVVTEADEYDRSFLQLHPTVAVITSTDADHLDIYGTHDELKKTFGMFADNIKPDGKLLIKKGVAVNYKNQIDCYTYSITEKADFHIENLTIEEGAYVFDFVSPAGVIEQVKSTYPGRINLENMIAAAAASILAGANPVKVVRSMTSFKGVNRRFDVRFSSDNITYIDDYAHHPTELEVTINSVKELYAGKKVLGIFQPHLFSRTQDFAAGFAESLDLLDEVILLDIYPARELPIKGVTTKIIFDKMKLENKSLMSKDDVIEGIKSANFDVLLTMGAGNIDTLVTPIVSLLTELNK